MSLTFKGVATSGDEPLAYIEGGKFTGNVIYLSHAYRTADQLRRVAMTAAAAAQGTEYVADVPPTLADAHASDSSSSEDEAATKSSFLTALVSKVHAARVRKAVVGATPGKHARSEAATTLPVVHVVTPSVIFATDGKLVPLPLLKTRDVIFIFGPSGSGKSTLAAQIAQAWKLTPLHKGERVSDRKVYLISRVTKDKSLDYLKPERIDIDNDFVEAHYRCEDFPENSFLIADDNDTLTTKERKAVLDLLNDILQHGRHRNIHILITAHLGSNYRETRIIHAESQLIIGFPARASPQEWEYLFGKLFSKNSAALKGMRALGTAGTSRWVGIRRTTPPIVLHEHGAYIVSDA